MSGNEKRQVAIVTGGASGIGLATAQRLRESGFLVGVLDIRKDQFANAWGGDEGVAQYECNVADRASVNAAVERVVKRFGVPTILVNSAGIYRPDHALDITDDDFDAMFAVNVRGTFIVSQAVARLMAVNRSGSIVNVSSVAATEATDVNGAYAATKGAVSALTRGLAVSLAPHGIRVNAVAPGPVATPMGVAAAVDPEREAYMLRRVLSGRFAEPNDVAGAILYLAGADSSYVTGHILNVDGGVLANR